MAETVGHWGSSEARGSGEEVGTTITACRYCLAQWAQSGPSATYTFLSRV